MKEFARQAEGIFRGSERRADLDKAYLKLIEAIFLAISRVASESQKTPREVVLFGELLLSPVFYIELLNPVFYTMAYLSPHLYFFCETNLLDFEVEKCSNLQGFSFGDCLKSS